MTILKQKSEQSISLLLPYYWWDELPRIVESLGFKLFWSNKPEVSQRRIEAEKLVLENEPDLAIEWQWGEDDFPIRDLLRKYGRSTPVILALNWSGQLPNEPGEIGYDGYLDVPFKIKEMLNVFYRALPEKNKHAFVDGLRIEAQDISCE